MTILRVEPWNGLARFSRDLERLLAHNAGADEAAYGVADWAPSIDIIEQNEQFVLHADLPGVNPSDLEVTLENGVLTLKGRRALENRTEHAGYKRVERVTGQFFRRFSLPDTTDGAAVRAKLNNGVLEVVIPKQAKSQPRKITVEAA